MDSIQSLLKTHPQPGQIDPSLWKLAWRPAESAPRNANGTRPIMSIAVSAANRAAAASRRAINWGNHCVLTEAKPGQDAP